MKTSPKSPDAKAVNPSNQIELAKDIAVAIGGQAEDFLGLGQNLKIAPAMSDLLSLEFTPLDDGRWQVQTSCSRKDGHPSKWRGTPREVVSYVSGAWDVISRLPC